MLFSGVPFVTTTGFSASDAKRVSYLFIFAAFVLMVCLHMETILITGLFSYLAMRKLHAILPRKWLVVIVFMFFLAGVFYGLGFFANEARKSLPEMASKAIPSVIEWAQNYQVELPFTDYESLKKLGMKTVNTQVRFLGSFAHGATRQFVFMIIGCVVAVNLFVSTVFELDRTPCSAPRNFYSLCCDEIAERFSTFYQSFDTVMGAQLTISAINTTLTTIFVLSAQLPYSVVIIGVTFLCGMLPVVGNLISNTVIIGIGFTISPQMALAALLFLVVIHKLEYFLNSKIIGGRIRNPIWLTMLGLVIGESLMGILGMIIAPVILHYVKVETAKNEISGD